MGTERQLWTMRPDKFTSLKYFASPEALIQRALDYFKWCDDNPMYKTEQIKKPGPPLQLPDGTIVPGETLIEIPVKRPYTNKGFCLFCGVNDEYFNNFIAQHKSEAEKEVQAEWLEAIRDIKSAIANQQYEGAASGFFQSNIVARMIGLAEKTENKVEANVAVKEVFKLGDTEFEW